MASPAKIRCRRLRNDSPMRTSHPQENVSPMRTTHPPHKLSVVQRGCRIYAERCRRPMHRKSVSENGGVLSVPPSLPDNPPSPASRLPPPASRLPHLAFRTWTRLIPIRDVGFHSIQPITSCRSG